LHIPNPTLSRDRYRAALLCLFIGVLVLAIKFYAYFLSGSTALFSDALESIVNVMTAGFALFALRWGDAPPDREHPYGHGKIEFITAVFEGGLISFAAIMIAKESITTLIQGPTPPDLAAGLPFVVLGGFLNGVLSLYLLRTAKRTQSPALEAEGKHVGSDALSTVGLLFGLGILALTGWLWIDAAIALLMALLLLNTGLPLMKRSLDSLLDAADQPLLQRVAESFEKVREPGVIRAHNVRLMRNGRRLHMDGHLVLPECWSVEEAHDKTEAFQTKIISSLGWEGEAEFHVDPCRRLYCAECEWSPCPIRANPFLQRSPITVAELQSLVDRTDHYDGVMP
jgi:cation diffusion facilitator family transporter